MCQSTHTPESSTTRADRFPTIPDGFPHGFPQNRSLFHRHCRLIHSTDISVTGWQRMGLLRKTSRRRAHFVTSGHNTNNDVAGMGFEHMSSAARESKPRRVEWLRKPGLIVAENAHLRQKSGPSATSSRRPALNFSSPESHKVPIRRFGRATNPEAG